MRKVLEFGGVAAGVLLIAFGIAAIVLGVNGRNTVGTELKQQQIVGSPDMTPAGIKTEAAQAGLKNVSLPTCTVAGKAVDNGADEGQNDGHGISVCHLSPVKGRLDARTYNMEILPAVKHGVRAARVQPYAPSALPRHFAAPSAREIAQTSETQSWYGDSPPAPVGHDTPPVPPSAAAAR